MKKVLIIAYYWPPAATAGVYRALKFAKYLTAFDWQPVIFTVRSDTHQTRDSELQSDIPPHIKIYRSLSFEPLSIYKKVTGLKQQEVIPTDILERKSKSFIERAANYIRLNFFIPDARIGWLPNGLSEGLKVIRSEKPHLIFSTSPPPTTHLLALVLSKLTNLPWVSDFRDPWVDFYHYESTSRNKLSAFIDKFLESTVLKKADCITAVNSGFFKTNSVNKAKCHIIPNGFDPDDLPPAESVTSSEKFTILYAGTLKMRRYVDSFFEVIENISRSERISQNLQLKLLGIIDKPVRDKIFSLDMGIQIITPGFLSHKETIREMVKSDMLLLVIDQSAQQKNVLTGKLFEYMMVRKPILAYGPEDGAAASILNNTKAGKMFSYDDSAGPARFILDRFEKWENGQDTWPVNVNELNIFNRLYLTKRLSTIFDSLT